MQLCKGLCLSNLGSQIIKRHYIIGIIVNILFINILETQSRTTSSKSTGNLAGNNNVPAGTGTGSTTIQIFEWKRQWPGGVIYYEISKHFNDASCQLILGAMKEISEKSCIKFQKRTVQSDYVFIRDNSGEGCHSTIGHRGGMQITNLDPAGCIRHGTIVHELLHSLGFHHEHQRPDRDTYITIYWDNIIPKQKPQFQKLDAPATYLKVYPYDYGSIMHYGVTSYFMSLDRSKPVIKAKMPGPKMGQRIALSDLDTKKINAAYCVLV